MPQADQQDPEQLSLFDGGIDVAQLRALAKSITGHQKAPSTIRAYTSDWKAFSKWCAAVGRTELPATPDTVMLFLAHELQALKVSTVERRTAAIAHFHHKAKLPSPTDDYQVQELLSGARRKHGTKPDAKAAITPDQLRDMCRNLPKTKKGTRDQAILLLGFASGMRRSELAALNLADIDVMIKGVRVRIGRSKTDQEGKGREIGIFRSQRVRTCPARAVERWLKVRGKKAGPLFVSLSTSRQSDLDRLSAKSIWQVVKDAVRGIGIDAGAYGAHSLRAGCVTTAIEAGTPESLVMKRTGHRSIQTVSRYVRPASIWKFDVLAKAL